VLRFGVSWLAASLSGLSVVELFLSRAFWIPPVASRDVPVAFMPLAGYRCSLPWGAPRASADSPLHVLPSSDSLTAADVEDGGLVASGL
jgi:hypothetical protein